MKQLFLSILLLLATGPLALAQNPADAILGEWLSAKKDSRVVIYREAAGDGGHDDPSALI